MKTWLHFIGRANYTKDGFIDEAKQHSVTRRVTLRQLKTMEFGDRVSLAILDRKSSLIFGYFLIERISGLNDKAMKVLSEKFGTKMISQGGHVVHRGCGSYIEGATLAIDASMEEIVEVLKTVDDIGKLMVGGAFFEHEEVRMKSLVHSRGFRLFDYEGFLVATHEAKQSQKSPGYPVVKGCWYAKPEDFDAGFEGPLTTEVQEVRDYEKKDEKDKADRTANKAAGGLRTTRKKPRRKRAKVSASA